MKPKVGISACLIGEKVRYDGGHKFPSLITQQLESIVELVPVCPEAGAGLGIPRPAVQLVRIDEQTRMRGVSNPLLDVTDAVESWIKEKLPQLKHLDAFILKARSPSCGYGSTSIYNQQGQVLNRGSGLFAAALLQTYPDMIIVEEENLQTIMAVTAFYMSLPT